MRVGEMRVGEMRVGEMRVGKMSLNHSDQFLVNIQAQSHALLC